MTKILLALIILCFPLSALGNNERLSKLERVKDSIVKVVFQTEVEGRKFNVSHGSGFVVLQSEELTVIATCAHVFQEDVPERLFAIERGDELYYAQECREFSSSGIDIAYMCFRPGIPGLKALKINTDNSSDVVEAIAFGFAMDFHIDGEQPEITYSVGRVKRAVGMFIAGGTDLFPRHYILHGTCPLIPGFSGGPLLNENFEVIGINSAYEMNCSVFIDSRILWNLVIELSKGNLVNVPIDETFNVFNMINEKRLKATKEGKLLLEDGTKISLDTKSIEKLIQSEDWISPKIKIIIDGVEYSILRFQFDKGFDQHIFYGSVEQMDSPLNYIYISKSGWRLFIHLDK